MNKRYFSDVMHKWSEAGNFSTENDKHIESELYKKLLEVVHVGPSYFMIFNPAIGEIVFHSDEMETILGYPKSYMTIGFIMNKIHPDDIERFIEFETAVVDFKKSLPLEKKMKYKTRYSYRLKKANGEYITVVQQSITIKLNEAGGIQHNLVYYTDISAFSPSNKMTLSFIGLEGEPSYIDYQPAYIYRRKNSPFTVKEREILDLMSKGLKSKEIAAELNRSVHTIHVHRKNLLSKSGCKTFNELISLCIKEGWVT